MIEMKDYQEHTDKYFLRSKLILEKEKINPLVRYQVFVRKDIDYLKGVNKAVEFIKEHAPDAKVYSLKDGQYCASCEPIMKIEGHVQDLIDLETVYLGHISGALTGTLKGSTIHHNAYGIIKAAQDKPVFYFGARHFDPDSDNMISGICHDVGFAGCSTDFGAKHWDSEGIGTVPHALILSVAANLKELCDETNPTAKTAQLFDKHISGRVLRIILIDTYNKEVSDTLASLKIANVGGVRIDTCGENYAEYISREIASDKIPAKYINGRGVCIGAVWALKKALLEKGFGNVKITVSSGFNAEKTTAFMEADKLFQWSYKSPLFDNIGTGSVYPDVVMATSDIVAYYSENDKKWQEHHKVGRGENPTKRLKLM
jgi:nicotinate phosphoribosyltransferase